MLLEFSVTSFFIPPFLNVFESKSPQSFKGLGQKPPCPANLPSSEYPVYFVFTLILALLLTSCVTLGKLLNLSESHFLHL